MQYPLTLTFKSKRLAAHLRITDAAGMPILFLQQQALKVKDAITVYRTEAKQQPLYGIRTGSLLGFNAAYTIEEADGTTLGTLTREGKASVLKASYVVEDAEGAPTFRIGADSAWPHVLSSFFEQIPVVGTIARGFVKPSYTLAADGSETAALKLSRPERSENTYTLEKTSDLDASSESLALTAVAMMLFRELDSD